MHTQVNAGIVSSVSHAAEFPGKSHRVVVRSRDRVLHDPGKKNLSGQRNSAEVRMSLESVGALNNVSKVGVQRTAGISWTPFGMF